MSTAEKFSAKEAAIQLGTDARTLRKFIRSSDQFDSVGQGNRYEFTKSEIKALKKAFSAWANGSKKKATATTSEKINEDIDEQDEVDATTEEVDLDDEGDPVEIDDQPDDVYELDELTGPEDEDLEEIDLEDEDLED